LFFFLLFIVAFVGNLYVCLCLGLCLCVLNRMLGFFSGRKRKRKRKQTSGRVCLMSLKWCAQKKAEKDDDGDDYDGNEVGVHVYDELTKTMLILSIDVERLFDVWFHLYSGCGFSRFDVAVGSTSLFLSLLLLDVLCFVC